MNSGGVIMCRLIVILLFLAGLSACGTPSSKPNAQASAKVHTELAGMYYELGKHGVALEELGLALQSDEDYAPAYSVRGLVHMALREDREAEEDFQKSLRLDDTDSDTHNNFGWFLCQHDRIKEAIPHFMAALKNPLYRTPERAYLNAGVCSMKEGATKNAGEFLQNALQLQPDLAQAWLSLAELNFEMGNYNSAKRYFLGFAERSQGMSAEQLWLGVRISRKTRDRNAESSYGLQLRKLYPGARETQMLLRGE